MINRIHIIGGGTTFEVRPHLSIGARAYGKTAKNIYHLCLEKYPQHTICLHLTNMAGGTEGLETNEDVSLLVDRLIADSKTKVIFMPVALCDYEGFILDRGIQTLSGHDQPRLKTENASQIMELTPAKKILSKIRKERKDIQLIAFKTTAGASEDQMFEAGLSLLKKNSCNLVLVNDLHTRLNMIVVPELSRYAVTSDRDQAIQQLVNIAGMRYGLTFARTNVADGELVDWSSESVPTVLREVVDYCIDHGAYLPFNDITVGHFGCRVGEGMFLSSRRKRNFNKREDRDLVRTTVDNDSIVAIGAKPSAGAHSQYMVLNQYPELDCIVHFHCPMKSSADISVRDQKPYECGSKECGQNTVEGLRVYGGVAAVMLDQHGPNIVFSSKGDPKEVIDFIKNNFDLTKTTR